ncbi:MAG: hypothetical protein J1F02_07860 [Lachnospiraceae bacterium]|nr:hypothetical protein [Lachnospiraceae bacterium]
MIPEKIYIPSIDAKDIYLASCRPDSIQADDYPDNSRKCYSLLLSNNQYDLRKFINSFDYSLDLIALQDIYYKKFRRRNFGFTEQGKSYTAHVMNITFQYAVREWNQTKRNLYTRPGYDEQNLTFQDGIARDQDGIIVGIRTGEPITQPAADLDACFAPVQQEGQLQYKKIKEPKILLSGARLRELLYEKGFICDGKHYVRCKRSAGSARVGKCLFIYEPLQEPLLRYSSGGITVNPGQEIDLAAYESYLALTTSSIIDTLPIRPENILVIEDYESVFTEEVMATESIEGRLQTREKTVTIANSIWDGQSLMDISLFGKYRSYGMLLLRNLMFKSCCFNCNLQQWFRDNQITSVSQLNGFTRAKRIEDVKLITTKSSIKYLKFDTLSHWLEHLYPEFGIVKHDKKPPFFQGELVQSHYQLINTLSLSPEEIRDFLAPSLEFAQQLGDNPAVVRYFIQYPDLDGLDPFRRPMISGSDVTFRLLGINSRFARTSYYRSFLHDLLAAFYKNLKNGHVLVHGNYSTILGNPMEMLLHSIGQFDGTSQLGQGNIFSLRFPREQTLLATRSPHVTMGNLWLPYNKENKPIRRYLNLTEEILCLNSIGENVLQRLSGADFDSDSVMLTDNPILIQAARRYYNTFKTPTSLVAARKTIRTYTPAEQADLDTKTSVNLIGEIINLSQELNSLLWEQMYQGAVYAEVAELYADICQLDVMSGIEIDKAKKEFDIHNKKELTLLRKKYAGQLTDESGKKKQPHFFAHIARQKGYYSPGKKSYCKYHTAMDYLQTTVNSFRIRHPYKKERLPFSAILDSRKFRASNVNETQIRKIYSRMSRFLARKNLLFSSSELSREEKRERYQLLLDTLTAEITSETIGFSTFYKLLHSLDEEEHRPYRKLLLTILFLHPNGSFEKAILASKEELEVWEPSPEGDHSLYGIPFHIHKKSV